MSKNVPITFVWMSLVQDHDWPERSTAKKIPSRVQIVAVAFVLMRHADADGQNVYPAVGTVAELAGVSLATVRNVYGVMRGEGFLRPDGNGRHRTLKYRLIYPSLSSQIDSAGSIPLSKSRQTTNRTELPSAHSSPKGDIVAPSANTERSVSVPKVEVDQRVLERKGMEFLRPFFERGEGVSFPESRSLAQKYYDDDLNDLWQSLTRTSVFSDMIRFMESNGSDYAPYEKFVSVLSGECKDRSQIETVMNDLTDRVHSSTDDAVLTFLDLYAIWRSEVEPGWYNDNDLGNSERVKSELNVIVNDKYLSSIVDSVEKLKRAMNDSRDRVMAIRAKSGSVSRSATNTGSDAMIVEKIVETVSEKVDEKDDERW